MTAHGRRFRFPPLAPISTNTLQARNRRAYSTRCNAFLCAVSGPESEG